jgi:PEP-CTERM motif
MRNLFKVLLGAFAAAGIVSTATAAVVTQWSAIDSATFTAATFSAVDPTQTSLAPLLLTWGDPTVANRSSLALANPVPPQTVNTFIGGGSPPPAFIVPGSTITHSNNPISGPTLTGATIKDTLTLTAVLPPSAGPGLLPPINFDIAFDETPNSPPCAVVSSPTPCNDIFVLLGGLFNQTFTYDSDGAGPDAPVTYFVNIFPTSGGVLSILDDSTCAAVHAVNPAAPATGCLGFTTPEGAATTLAFGYTISTLPLAIPEPGTIALVGLALLGVGASRRRARS